MTLQKEIKADLMNKFAKTPNDTGSVEVQCAVLTERIKQLTEHLKDHKKDFSSRNGLARLVARRKRLLKYLARKDQDAYLKLLNSLGLKTVK